MTYYVVLTTIHGPGELQAQAWDVHSTLFKSREEAQEFIDQHTQRTISSDEWVTVKEFNSKRGYRDWTAEFRIRPVRQ